MRHCFPRVLIIVGLFCCVLFSSFASQGQDAMDMPENQQSTTNLQPSIPITDLRPIVDTSRIYTPEQLQADATALQQCYPGLISLQTIGQSREGRPLIALRIGNGAVAVMLNGAHHGREWITSLLLMQMIDAYALAYYHGERLDGFDPVKLLTQVSIWVVPMVNPDGVAIAQQGTSAVANAKALLKLNAGSLVFSAWKSNARGIDLNRQYQADWKHIANPAAAPGPGMYKGVAPMTEPEVVSLALFAKSQPFKAHVAFHSSGEVIFWHFKQQGAFRHKCAVIANHLSQLTGYRLVQPQRYESGGGYKDWVVMALHVPAYTIEVGPPVGAGQVPLTEYPHIWQKVRAVGLLMAQEVAPSQAIEPLPKDQ